MGFIQKLARMFCGHQPEIDFLNLKLADLQKLILIEEPKPDIEVLFLPKADVQLDIQPLNLKMMYPALIDSQYYYTKAEDWAEIFNWIYLEFDMPKWVQDAFDCDDAAMLLSALTSAFFGLNYFAVVFGKSPVGYHGWNIFRDEQGLVQFEPQTGEYFPLGERYFAEYILL